MDNSSGAARLPATMSGMRSPKPWPLPTQPVTRELLSAAGVSDEMIRTQLRSGRLMRLRHGVYLASDAWPTGDAERHVMLARAEQVTNPTAVISHASAAVVWGLSTPGFTPWHASAPTVTLPADGPHAWRGTAIRHQALLPSADLARDEGYTVTSVARTAIDLAGPLPLPEALAIVDHAARLIIASYVDEPRRRDYSNPRFVAAALETLLTTAGRHRSRLQPMLDLVVPARESPAESLTAGYLHLAGTPMPLFQAEISVGGGKVYPDFFWPDLGLIGEVDGLVKYTDPRAIGAEKQREQHLLDLGYQIVRWLASEIMTRPDLVVARIERAMAAATR